MAGINGVGAKESKIVILLRSQCLPTSPYTRHLKPLSPLIPPPIFPYLSHNLVFHNIWIARHYLNSDLAFTNYISRVGFYPTSTWKYVGVSILFEQRKTFEDSYKTLKPFRVQYLSISLHRLKLVLPWNESAKVKYGKKKCLIAPY